MRMTLGQRWGRFVVARPTSVLWVAVLACLLFATGALRLAPSADYRIFFAADDPARIALDEVESTFSKTDNVVFVLKPRQGDAFGPDTLAAVQELTEAAWTLPHARRVDSLANVTVSRSEGDELFIEPLLPAEAEAWSPAVLDRVRAAALDEPLLTGSLVAADGGTLGVNVTLRLPDDGPLEVVEAADAARALAATVRAAHPDLEVRVSGLAMLNDAFMQASVREIAWSVPLMAFIMLVGMALLLRSTYATVCICVVVGLASSVAMGAGGWFGYPLTPISASAPTIIITLCIADGVHVFLGVRHAMQRGVGQDAAIVESLAANLRPVFLTSVSTVIGFLALNFADSPPFWHMANMTAGGVVAAFALSVSVLPAMLALRPLAIQPVTTSPISGLWGRWSRGVLRHRHAVVALGAALGIASVFAAGRLESNDQFVEYFDESVAWRADTDFLVENLGGIYVVDYVLPSAGSQGVHDPAYLAVLDDFAGWLREQPGVSHVSSVADLQKRLNESFAGATPGSYALPDSSAAAAQLLMSYEMSLPPGLELTDRVDLDKSTSKLTVVLDDLSTAELLALQGRSEAWLADRAAHSDGAAEAATGISPVVLFSTLSDRNTGKMVWGNVFSLLLISLGLVGALRSAKLGVLSLLPNLLPIVFAYGTWALLYTQINIVSSVAAAVCLGVVVDDTIHFLSKYQRSRQRMGVIAALHHTTASVGTALVVTSIVLVGGFAVLAQSTFAINAVFGQLVVMVVVYALVADLLFLPAALALAEGTSPASVGATRRHLLPSSGAF